jgi:hypothetical protein
VEATVPSRLLANSTASRRNVVGFVIVIRTYLENGEEKEKLKKYKNTPQLTTAKAQTRCMECFKDECQIEDGREMM